MDTSWFRYESVGRLQFDPGLGTHLWEPWWAILVCDGGIVDYYTWHLRRYGIALHKGSTFGPHITVVRGQEPPDKAAWGLGPGPVAFRYTNVIRWDNGYHAWLDVWSPQLAEIRAKLGLDATPKMSYHLTLGRLVFPRASVQADDAGGMLEL
jgi:hypothetical protein